MRGNNKLTGGNKSTFFIPVILGLVPRIFWQRVSNLINKFALLLHKCWYTQDSRNKSENDRCRRRGLSAFCQSFKYPSPDAKALPSPSRGEGMHRPWYDKILGTRPSMTGARGAGFVRLLRRCTPRNDVVNDTPHSALPRHSLPQGAREHGRSMIEMLGVLAIIGVLSVGGIAGYSKAMEKYKVNKTVSEYSNFIFGMLEHLESYKNLTQVDDGKQISLANTINNTVSVPPNWVLNGGFSDSNGNQLYIVSRNNRLVLDIYLGTISINDKGQFVSDNFSTNLCRELFLNLVQPISDTLYWARLYRANEAAPVKFFGNKTCNGADRKCLQAITLSEIDATCKLCVKGDYCCIGLEF